MNMTSLISLLTVTAISGLIIHFNGWAFFWAMLIFLALLSILIICHELGHFLVAKKCGMKVERFGFGLPFGPTLWSRKYGETEYCVHAALIGGYVSFPDDDPESDVPADSPRRFENQPWLNRFAVAIAGVTVNAILGWLIMAGVILGWGFETGDAFIGDVMKPDQEYTDVVGGEKTVRHFDATETRAYDAGLQTGDVIIAVAGEPIKGLHQQTRVRHTIHLIRSHAGEETTITVRRNGEEITQPITPTARGTIGITLPMRQDQLIRTSNPIEALGMSYQFLTEFLVMNFEAMGKMFTGEVSTSELSGPVEITTVGAKVIEQYGMQYGLKLAAIISVILAVMNILPIPALDGGHILFLLIEAVKGSPLKREIQEQVTQVGFMGLLLLMCFVLWNDGVKMWDRINGPDEQANAGHVIENRQEPQPAANRLESTEPKAVATEGTPEPVPSTP